MKRILRYLKPNLSRMSIGILIKFAGAVMDLLLPWILAYMLDHVVPSKNTGRVFAWGGLMVFCSVAALLSNIIANRIASRVSRDTTRVIRHDLFAKISSLSCRQMDEFTIPSLESRLTSDTYNIHLMIGMMQRMGVRAPILLVGGILITLTLDPVLTLVLLSVLPFVGAVAIAISKKGIPLYTKLQRAADKMVRKARENFAGIRVIKALSKTEYEKERFAQTNADVVAKEKKAGITMGISNPLMNLLLNFGLTLVILAGAFRANEGLTQPGSIIAFLSYFTLILNALLSINRIFVVCSKGSASARRITEVLDAPQDLTLGSRDPAGTADGVHISFEDVSFSYTPGAARPNLSHISFQVQRGETLGIIGATGCGKSTIIQLLLRFYDPDSGEIRIGGDKVQGIPPEELYAKFGIAFQNDVLFANSIEENIAFGRSLEKEQIRRAAESAQARMFIDELEEGYGHQLTAKGTNLSGGQKQRLLIARALASKPEILILDDSSSALDYKTDAGLRQNLALHYQDTTTIMVAQRISSIMGADHIMVLDNGQIIGYGTHEELIKSCPAYREIGQSQMGIGGEESA